MNHSTGAALEASRSFFREKLVPVALGGLKRMFAPDRAAFSSTARLDADGKFAASGTSNRYTAMVLIGLASQARLGAMIDLPLEATWGRMCAWAARQARLGDVGLMLWALSVRSDERAEDLAGSLLQREQELFDQMPGAQSMALGWLLAGAGEAMRNGVGGAGLEKLASRACARLLANRWAETGLFCFGQSGFRRNVLKSRVNRRLGSFASQVYSTLGLAKYAHITGCKAAFDAAVQCADQMCNLQGDDGQWWWIYSVRRGCAVMRYPVYSVHQDAMGPIALLATMRTKGTDERYARAIDKSLTWMEHHPEMTGVGLIDAEHDLIWRAIQRDDPSRTGAYGLGRADRWRKTLAAWTNAADTRAFEAGHLCNECRSYHLGWILLAAAMADELEVPAG